MSIPSSHVFPIDPFKQPYVQFPVSRWQGPLQFTGHGLAHRGPNCVGGQP